MDISLPIATAVGLCTVLISGGVSWGVTKMSVSKNSRDIAELRKDFLTSKEFKTFREGCQALILTKIEEVKKDQKELKIDIKDALKTYDNKREEAREESQKTLQKINTFIGRVDEYIRLKNGH